MKVEMYLDCNWFVYFYTKQKDYPIASMNLQECVEYFVGRCGVIDSVFKRMEFIGNVENKFSIQKVIKTLGKHYGATKENNIVKRKATIKLR